MIIDSMNTKRFFSELKRRNVYKVAITYGITAWLIAQIAGLVTSTFQAAPWVMKMIIIILIIGFPIILIFSWIFEMSSKGFVKTAPADKDDTENEKMPRIKKYKFIKEGFIWVKINSSLEIGSFKNRDNTKKDNSPKTMAK